MRRAAGRFGRVLAACLAASWLMSPGPASAQAHCTSTEATTAFGKWTSPGLAIQPGLTTYEPTGVVTGRIASLRLLVELHTSTAKRWTLTMRDHDLRVLASMGAGDFMDADGRPRRRVWTGMLRTGVVVFDLQADGGKVDLQVDSALVYPERIDGVPQYSVKAKDNPDWKDLYPQKPDVVRPLRPARQAGDTVGMLVSAVEKDGRKDSWCCSGVLLSPTILLTNWHCGGMSILPDDSVWKGDVCPNSLIDLGWDQSNERRQYGCKSVILRNSPLDFVLLRLTSIVGSGAASGEARPVRLSVADVTADQDLFMVHHALCQQKLVSTCRVLAKEHKTWRASQGQSGDLASAGDPLSDFTHSCDTEPGASGSAVFNLRGELVGLHHLGYERDAAGTCDGRNKAVKIKEILKVIKRDAPAAAAEIGIPDLL